MDNLKNNILSGDLEAFKKWMEIHIEQVERFAVQYGATPREAGKVAETLFGNLFSNLGQLNEEQLEDNALFKTAMQQVTELHVEAPREGLFSFEEDNELHKSILGMPKDERIAFILSHFHEKSIEDIAWFMETPIEHVDDLLQNARRLLDGPNIEKRLGFLNKSFHRLRPTFDERNIFYAKPKEVHIDEPINKVSRTKKPLYQWLIGSAMLLLIMSVTVVNSDAYQQSSAEKFIENKKNSYQQKLEDQLEAIGIDQPDEDEVDQFLDYYAGDTKMRFTRYIANLESQMEKGRKIDRKAANQTYETLTQQLRLPSEMIEELQENPLTESREESLDFMDELYLKVSYLTNVYMMTLYEHEEILLSAELSEGGIVDIDRFLAMKSEYPLELQKTIDGMGTQALYLSGIKDIAPLIPTFGTPEVVEVLEQNLHPDMKVYVYMLSGESNRVVYNGTLEERMDAFAFLEQEIPKTKKRDSLYHLLEGGYRWLFFSVTGVHQPEGIYEHNLSIKPEIKEQWMQLASREENTMAVQIMREMVSELEEQNWRSSMEYEVVHRLYAKLDKKLNEAREGNQ